MQSSDFFFFIIFLSPDAFFPSVFFFFSFLAAATFNQLVDDAENPGRKIMWTSKNKAGVTNIPLILVKSGGGVLLGHHEKTIALYLDRLTSPRFCPPSNSLSVGYTYDTSDLACIRYRIEEQKGDWLIYVVDAGQVRELCRSPPKTDYNSSHKSPNYGCNYFFFLLSIPLFFGNFHSQSTSSTFSPLPRMPDTGTPKRLGT